MTCKSFNTEDICKIEMHETLNTQANKVSIKLHLNLPPFRTERESRKNNNEDIVKCGWFIALQR